MSLYKSYVNFIKKCLRVPVKIVAKIEANGNFGKDKHVPKLIIKYTQKDIKKMYKDKKLCSIYFMVLIKTCLRM